MLKNDLKRPIFIVTVSVLLLGITISGYGQQPEVFSKNGFAIGGYDVVEYFTSSKPVKGDTSFYVIWNSAKWIFSSRENAALFSANPLQYAPQYGGYCAYGLSKGYKAPTSEDAWSIVDRKLYFNYNRDVKSNWEKDHQGFIRKADSNWVKVRVR